MWLNWTRPVATRKLAKVNYILNILFSTLAFFSKIIFIPFRNCAICWLRKELFWPYGLADIFLGIKLFFEIFGFCLILDFVKPHKISAHLACRQLLFIYFSMDCLNNKTNKNKAQSLKTNYFKNWSYKKNMIWLALLP